MRDRRLSISWDGCGQNIGYNRCFIHLLIVDNVIVQQISLFLEHLAVCQDLQ